MTNCAGAKYTPGPWEVLIFEEGIETTGCGPVKTTYKSHQSNPQAQQEMEAEALANALLIAAAPDLLEACEGLLKLAHAITGDEETIVKKAQAAIAKVKGGK